MLKAANRMGWMLGRILLVALGYYLSGRLGLLLAIPPGYATAVWPASGLALAAVLLIGHRAAPGIFIGSFAINILTGFDASSLDALLRSLPVPTVIALGAVLQAQLGALLIQRFVGYHNILAQELQVVWLLALGGPLACLVNSTIGVGSLYFKGLIPTDNLLFNWWTWWVGDSIGVLVFTPLVLIWSLSPAAHWRRRQLTATVPLLVMFSVVVWLFVFISGQEQERVRLQFTAESRDTLTRFQRDLRNDFQALHALSAFAGEQEPVQRDAFERFASRQLDLLVGVKSLSWVAVVSDAQRASFEQRQRDQGLVGYSILERDDSSQQLRPAAPRPHYAPVTYIVPAEGNAPALGFDDESEPSRAGALRQARLTGQPSASDAITLVQDNQPHRGMLLVLAVNRPDGSTRGYAIAAVRVDLMIAASLLDLENKGIDVRVYETASGAQLYGAPPRTERGGLSLDLPIEVGGRAWQFHFSQPASYLLAHRSWAVWMMLAGGMLFTGLLGMFLLVVIGRSSRVEQLVVERTVALAQANSQLAQEAERSQRLEQETRHRAEQLASSNRELEQFAYVASHDLQAPLRNIGSFARLLERRYQDKLSEEANEFLGFIRESVTELQQLIEDLLSLSKVNPGNTELHPVPLGEAVRRACEQLRESLKETGARLHIEALPPVRGDTRLLVQLFQNLIANAIKFQRAGVVPEVSIRANREKSGDWRCEVADNGIGIAAEHLPKLFQIFRRLHSSDQYPGTGIGLALCRKIVGLHGGRIWVESTPGVGSRFIFTLPSA